VCARSWVNCLTYDPKSLFRYPLHLIFEICIPSCIVIDMVVSITCHHIRPCHTVSLMGVSSWLHVSDFFSSSARTPSGPGPSYYPGFTITLRHTKLDRTPLEVWSARRRDLYLTIHNHSKRQTSISPAGFETRNPSKRMAAGRRLRPHRHRGRLMFLIRPFTS
jgi:hypothetical protein